MANRQVLIVEDDDAIRQLVHYVAQRGGYETSSAINGAEAISALTANDYCAVILDLMMPAVDGYDVIMHIKRNALSVPVIIVTAAVKALDWNRIDKSIVKAVLLKPFDINALSEALASVCP
jgi:CheY-like chemotaxis protein